MTTIDRYIARTFLSGYVILLAVGIGLYVLTDMLVNLDEFTEDPSLSFAQVAALMADYYGHNLSLYFSQLGGPMLAIAGAFTIAMMLKNNELTALVAAGVPLQRLAVPILLCSVFLSALWMANRELIMPAIAPQIARTHDDVVGSRTDGVYCARDDNNAILTALRLYPRAGQLSRVYIIEPDAHDRPKSLIEADLAQYVPERRTWRLERGRRLLMRDPAQAPGLGPALRYESVDEYPFTLSPDDLALRRGSQWSEFLSVRQLSALLKHKLPNRATIGMSLHIRLTQPILQFTLLLLALPFFLTREPGSVLAAGGRALLLCGIFFGLTFVAHTIVKDEAWTALWAWVPIFIFGPVAVMQLANVKT